LCNIKLNMSITLISTDLTQLGVYSSKHINVDYTYDQDVKELYCIVACIKVSCCVLLYNIYLSKTVFNFMLSAQLFPFNIQFFTHQKILKWDFPACTMDRQTSEIFA
jgi:hypothetical protein